MRRIFVILLFLLPMHVQAADAISCSLCDAWNQPQQAFRVHGNTYYVGTHGLSAILITSNEGHILIDGALPQSVPQIGANIRALGFRVRDVKLLLNSHVHFDHAGGLADLQRNSGARVAASPWSAAVLKSGKVSPDDAQFGVIEGIPPVAGVETIADGQVLRAGVLSITAHFTPGHTPGGTSWSWQSCENNICRAIVYADSMTAVSADGFRFMQAQWATEGFPKSFAVLESLPCDILITPHPDFSDLFGKLQKRGEGADAFYDPTACRTLAANARSAFEKRLASEAASKP